MNELTNWLNNGRGLHSADPNKQILKLGEEFGELPSNCEKQKKAKIKDDRHVCGFLTILSMQYDLSIKRLCPDRV
ncbi:hypothetical protein P7H17_24005 [Paenibacillus larvae]|nr:hypothetical protein [Paenibacillus larvae]MDT2288497.1 hypothetical protein [Paenibacillus larvae]